MTPLDAAYKTQRGRISQAVLAATLAAYRSPSSNQEQTIQTVVPLVTAGQEQTASLVDAYMAAKATEVVGAGTVKGLDPSLYTTEVLRGVTAASVYARPFTVYHSTLAKTGDEAQAVTSAQALAKKLAVTDIQLAQTHAARDWMNDEPEIVGYRRVLNPPSCPLCTAASTRTYSKADLMPIHEHCDCGVEPLWGTQPVPAVGTSVRVEIDPELGPRLMADSWQSVGPTLTLA